MERALYTQLYRHEDGAEPAPELQLVTRQEILNFAMDYKWKHCYLTRATSLSDDWNVEYIPHSTTFTQLKSVAEFAQPLPEWENLWWFSGKYTDGDWTDVQLMRTTREGNTEPLLALGTIADEDWEGAALSRHVHETYLRTNTALYELEVEWFDDNIPTYRLNQLIDIN